MGRGRKIFIKSLQIIYENRNEKKYFFEYIRYLYRVDPDLWTAINLEKEFNLGFQTIDQILRPLKQDENKR